MPPMARVSDTVYQPVAENRVTYDRLYALYRKLHDLSGTRDYADNPFDLLRELIAIRDEVRNRETPDA